MADNDDQTLVTMTAPGGDISEAGGSKTFTISLSRALVDGEVLPINLKFETGNDYADPRYGLYPVAPDFTSIRRFLYELQQNRRANPRHCLHRRQKCGQAHDLYAHCQTGHGGRASRDENRPYEKIRMRIKDFHGQSGLGGGADGNPEPDIQFRILDDDGSQRPPGPCAFA